MLVQAFLLVVLFASDAFNFAVSIIASLILVPYALSAGFAVKTALADRRAGAIGGGDASSRWIVISFLTLTTPGS